MSRSIRVSKVYDFPIADLWQALTSADAMSEWLMPCNFVAELGHEFQFKTKPAPGFNGIIDCKVLALEEEKLLSYSWSGGTLKNSVVTFKLTPEGDKTRLDFEHSGFDGLVNRLIIRRILANGWTKKILITLLPQYLAK